jgi:hypothetical protein
MDEWKAMNECLSADAKGVLNVASTNRKSMKVISGALEGRLY